MWCKIFDVQDNDKLIPETQVSINMAVHGDDIIILIIALLDLRNHSINDFYWISEKMVIPSYELGIDIIENFTEKSAIAFLNRQIASEFPNFEEEIKITTEDILKINDDLIAKNK